MYPTDYRYTSEHQWIQASGSVATIGITDYAQQELGDIISVELPKIGSQLKVGQLLGTVESIKAVSDLMSPVSCEVTDVNTILKNAPETINKDPHGAGWIAKVRLADVKEIVPFMDVTAYEAFVAEKSKEASA
ncbi:MAG TPA: glycine cleavage system protein GcvH [Candidatus Aquilonibacter sp.]|nr:glycine cleavage system protein GcvH [Candidatus Aquilonibacter sp.]